MLTEVHRQAGESAIIRLATLARQGKPIPYGEHDGFVWKMRRDQVEPQQILRGGQVICGRNATRLQLNLAMKQAAGFSGVYPTGSGEKMICLKNRNDIGVINGMFVTLDRHRRGRRHLLHGADHDRGWPDGRLGATDGKRISSESTRGISTITFAWIPIGSGAITKRSAAASRRLGLGHHLSQDPGLALGQHRRLRRRARAHRRGPRALALHRDHPRRARPRAARLRASPCSTSTTLSRHGSVDAIRPRRHCRAALRATADVWVPRLFPERPPGRRRMAARQYQRRSAAQERLLRDRAQGRARRRLARFRRRRRRRPARARWGTGSGLSGYELLALAATEAGQHARARSRQTGTPRLGGRRRARSPASCRDAAPIAGTLAERYLRARGLDTSDVARSALSPRSHALGDPRAAFPAWSRSCATLRRPDRAAPHLSRSRQARKGTRLRPRARRSGRSAAARCGSLTARRPDRSRRGHRDGARGDDCLSGPAGLGDAVDLRASGGIVAAGGHHPVVLLADHDACRPPRRGAAAAERWSPKAAGS